MKRTVHKYAWTFINIGKSTIKGIQINNAEIVLLTSHYLFQYKQTLKMQRTSF